MLRHKLRLLGIAALALLFIFLGIEYKSVPINDRAFVLGMGMDYTDGVYELTCEILVPSKGAGGGSANQESNKILTGKGIDPAHALNDIFEKTGKLPSLGHCNILLLGEDVYKRDILKELEFFIRSDAFTGSTPVAVTEGKAKDLMNTKTPLENFASLSLHKIISVYGQKTNAKVSVLQDFRQKLLSPSASAFLTVIKTKTAEAGGDNGEDTAAGAADEPLVFYDCSSTAVFKNGLFAGILDSEGTAGMRLLKSENNFESFKVPDGKGGSLTVILTTKTVKTKISLGAAPVVNYEIIIKLKSAEAEELNAVDGFTPSGGEINATMREGVKAQMLYKINEALNNSAATSSDFLYLGNKFFAHYGKAWESYTASNPDYMSKINFNVKIVVK